jgi:hypothetical protein
MSAFSNSLENDFLLHYFQNADIANVGDAGGLQNSTTAGSLFVSLHTANPGEAGSQTTSECAYTNYARVAVARSSAGWTVASNAVSNAAAVTFPESDTSETAMFWGIGRSTSGAGTLDFYGHIGAAVKLLVVEAADLTGNDITVPSHGYVNDDRVVFYATMGSALPTGITEGTVYFVLATTTDTFTISTTQDGSAVDITAVGSGVVGKVTPIAIADTIAPNFAIGALQVSLF